MRMESTAETDCKLVAPMGNVTSARWQVTLCDTIWHVSSHNGEASCKLLYSIYLLTYLSCCLLSVRYDAVSWPAARRHPDTECTRGVLGVASSL